MPHYKQQFPPGLRQQQAAGPQCPNAPAHEWEMTADVRSQHSDGGYEWEEQRWVCRHCQTAQWTAKGLKPA
jgi:hypothetical protein